MGGSLTGCAAAADSLNVQTSAPAVDTANAFAQLKNIPVKGRAPKTGYSRDEFGPGWADIDHNGCDTRNDILARDLTGETFKAGTDNCLVTTGVLADKYTGTTINFVRGQDTSSAVQIDHVVALGDAWQKGAQQLSVDERKQLANDPLNLMATDGPTNRAKGDEDAATWLPPNKAFRCEYVARQTAVNARYGLWVTQAEHDAISRVLENCKQRRCLLSSPVGAWLQPGGGTVILRMRPGGSMSFWCGMTARTPCWNTSRGWGGCRSGRT